MLGHGYTDKPGHPLEVAHYVDHLLTVFDAIGGAQKVYLSGESLGGWVAARAASDHPRSDRATGPQHRRRVTGRSRGDEAHHHAVHGRRREPGLGYRAGAHHMADGRQVQGYDDIVASRQKVYQQAGFVAAMSDIMALQDPQIRARNLLGPAEYGGAITAPTLVLWTSDDPTADVSEGRRISEMIPGARFEVMSGCGHWPQYEDPKTFNRLHLDFLLGGGHDGGRRPHRRSRPPSA